jgi:hypothetical protein
VFGAVSSRHGGAPAGAPHIHRTPQQEEERERRVQQRLARDRGPAQQEGAGEEPRTKRDHDDSQHERDAGAGVLQHGLELGTRRTSCQPVWGAR